MGICIASIFKKHQVLHIRDILKYGPQTPKAQVAFCGLAVGCWLDINDLFLIFNKLLNMVTMVHASGLKVPTVQRLHEESPPPLSAFVTGLYFFKSFFIISFIFGCPGSVVGGGFSSCDKWRLLSSCGAWASHCGGFSCCGARALGLAGFSNCGSWALEHRLNSCRAPA